MAICCGYREAVPVDGVATGQHSRGTDGVKQELKADGAVLAHAVLHTHVVVLHAVRTASTCIHIHHSSPVLSVGSP